MAKRVSADRWLFTVTLCLVFVGLVMVFSTSALIPTALSCSLYTFLFLAFFLECRTRSIDDWRDTLLPAIIPTAAFLGLIIFQPDLGTAIACAAITGSVLFVAGLRLRYLGYALLASLAPLYFLIFH